MKVFDLNIDDEFIKPVSVVKLSAVLIDDNLSFNEHVRRLNDRQMRHAELLNTSQNECRLNIYQTFISLNSKSVDIV